MTNMAAGQEGENMIKINDNGSTEINGNLIDICTQAIVGAAMIQQFFKQNEPFMLNVYNDQLKQIAEGKYINDNDFIITNSSDNLKCMAEKMMRDITGES